MNGFQTFHFLVPVAASAAVSAGSSA